MNGEFYIRHLLQFPGLGEYPDNIGGLSWLSIREER